VKNSKISENILFIIEYTELIGILQLLATLLLSNGPIKSAEGVKTPILPQTVVSASILGVKVLNNIARLDLQMFQVTIYFYIIERHKYTIVPGKCLSYIKLYR
jgi:hypothetical protein